LTDRITVTFRYCPARKMTINLSLAVDGERSEFTDDTLDNWSQVLPLYAKTALIASAIGKVQDVFDQVNQPLRLTIDNFQRSPAVVVTTNPVKK
jgi:hypothetical protein